MQQAGRDNFFCFTFQFPKNWKENFSQANLASMGFVHKELKLEDEGKQA